MSKTKQTLEEKLKIKLHDYIEAKGITIYEMSNNVGCTFHTINRWFLGTQSMKLSTWTKIANYITKNP